MDNISHTLIGVLVGEAISRTLSTTHSSLPSATRRTLLVGLMAVGSNFPDLDFIYSAVTGNKLDYLLQHRGHTHTIVGAILIAIVLFSACWAWARFRKLRMSRSDQAALFGAAFLAPLLHIAMDFTNSYGVHPFWPVSSRWIYGDSVFIVEPLLWAASAPLVFVLKTWMARALVALVLVSGIVLSFTTGMVPSTLAVGLSTFIGLLLALGRFASGRAAVLAGVAVWIGCTTMFFTASHMAAAEIRGLAQRSASGRLIDQVLTPMPVNPVCWDVIAINADDISYSLTHLTLSLAPDWMPAADCPLRGEQNISAPLTPVKHPGSAAIRWRGEIVLSKMELQMLAAKYCQAEDLLRFARAPFFIPYADGTLIGDLRFDREPQADFAEVEIEHTPCPALTAPWVPPRADLLGP